jgi:hypothetical protein
LTGRSGDEALADLCHHALTLAFSLLSCRRAAAFASLSVTLGCSSADDEEPAPTHSGYVGDELALLRPAANEGMQIHYGPKSYRPEDMKAFVVPSGGETVDIQYVESTNDKEILFNAYQQRMRPGAHHLIVAHGSRDYQEGLYEATLPPFDMEMLFGAQAGSLDVPTPGQPMAPEDEGLAFKMGPRRQLALNAHFINTTSEPLLREAWFNISYADPATIDKIAGPVFLIGGLTMAVQPQTTELLQHSAEVPHDMRIVWAFGHFHSHTVRMSAFVRRAGSTTRELIYETYDYREPLYVGYNSIVTTPVPDPVKRVSGAHSGLLEVKKGDHVEWECEVVNNDDFVLTFASELTTAEMCCFFGFYTPSREGESWRMYHE